MKKLVKIEGYNINRMLFIESDVTKDQLKEAYVWYGTSNSDTFIDYLNKFYPNFEAEIIDAEEVFV